MEQLLGKDAPLYELSALISKPGSHRQPLHPDTPFGGQTGAAGEAPLLFSAFVALQDVK
jgi:hypothetical protein